MLPSGRLSLTLMLASCLSSTCF
ncbi:MAG: hypothetical protein JWR50_1119, partial [Mucilaginibacter sp.]|nr:hypothetical protein [Mucilaginibacter sp.]